MLNTPKLLCNYCVRIIQITYLHLFDQFEDGLAAFTHPIYLGNYQKLNKLVHNFRNY
jgi:hypothetical protein